MIVLKFNLRAHLEKNLGYKLVRRVNIKIKIIIIKVLKPDLKINPARNLGHRSRGLAWDHPGQHKN